MQAILLSVKPCYVSLILNGDKRWVFRKNAPRFQLGTRVYIYATYPISQIVGYFTLGCVICGNAATLYARTYKQAGISPYALERYANGHSEIYAWEVINPQIFETSKKLEEFGLTRPPQSYCYINI